jgi:1,4-alpha-glucan branching enzyme
MVSQISKGLVEFRFFRPTAERVTLSGDFNQWQNNCRLRKAPSGWWQCRLRLSPGIYQFHYEADGQRFIDYAAFGIEPGQDGWYSVLLVDNEVGQPREFKAA